MPRHCAAYGCSNNAAKQSCKDRNVSFHRFPLKSEELLKRWLVEINREGFKPNGYSFLCSDHFIEDDFCYQSFTNRREIKKDAVPSIFSYKPAVKREITSSQFGSSVVANPDPDPELKPEPEPATKDACCQTDYNVVDVLVEKISKLEEQIKELELKLEKTKICPSNFNDEELNLMTGYDKQQFAVLTNVLKFHEAKDIQKFFIFLMRLRTGITEDVLGIILRKSQSYISKVTVSMTSIIFEKIKPINIWPSKENIKMSMPSAFCENYPECRVIVDVTEFPIQKPTNLVEQEITFNYHKNVNTIKCVIGITPSGGISFISDTCGGSVPDKNLFLKSGIMDVLEKGDMVMADSDFLIREELKSIGCELITPNFLKGKIQFDITEKKENKKIVRHRIHVERAINRFKVFRLFNGKIPYNMLPQIHKIIYIVSFFINFGNPLVKL